MLLLLDLIFDWILVSCSGKGRGAAFGAHAAAQSDRRFNESKQAKAEHRPAEQDNAGIGNAQHERPRLHSSRYGVQHRKSEHAVGQQQTRRDNAPDDAEHAIKEAQGDRNSEDGGYQWREGH